MREEEESVSKSPTGRQANRQRLKDSRTLAQFFLCDPVGIYVVDLLSYESKTTDKRQQNDWMARKNLDAHLLFKLLYYV